MFPAHDYKVTLQMERFQLGCNAVEDRVAKISFFKGGESHSLHLQCRIYECGA